MGNTADHGQTGEYKIARLDEDKLPDVSRLHQKIYGITPKENYFHEKYDTSYTGVMHIGFLAYDKNNEPVAFYGVIPCFIQLGNRIVPAAQSADTMTHPSHRNKGLFTRLATLTFELCRQDGIALVFGFPNQNSHHGLLALGWKVTERMERFSIPVGTFPLESLAYKFTWSRRAYGRFAKKSLQRYFHSRHGLSNSLVTSELGGVYRDEKYLQYKTYSSSEVIQVGKGKIWYKIQNGFSIGDMSVTEKEFVPTIEQLKKICRRLGLTQMNFQSSPGTPLALLFGNMVSPIPSFPISFLDLGCGLDLTKLKFTFADIDIF